MPLRQRQKIQTVLRSFSHPLKAVVLRCLIDDTADGERVLSLGPRNQPNKGTLLFRFTKIWEKIIVIIREKCSERILINQERVEPRFA